MAGYSVIYFFLGFFFQALLYVPQALVIPCGVRKSPEKNKEEDWEFSGKQYSVKGSFLQEVVVDHCTKLTLKFYVVIFTNVTATDKIPLMTEGEECR